MRPHTILVKVLNRIRTLNLVVSPKKGSTVLQDLIVEQLGIAKQSISRPGWFKLNVDDSAQGKFTIEGGVIRN